MKCVWCEGDQAVPTKKDCQWIEPGGIETVIVTEVPAIDCPDCHDIYVEDDINEEIEIALNTVDLEKLGTIFSYHELLNAPKMSIFQMMEQGISFRCK